MSNKLVTIATFSTTIEAEVLRQRLEHDGIFAIVADNSAAGLLAVGSVKLKVSDDDLPRAQALLQQHLDEIDAGQDEDAIDWTCFKCGEKNSEKFEVCWSCGTSCEGEEDPGFVGETDEPIEDADRLVVAESLTTSADGHVGAMDDSSWSCPSCRATVAGTASQCPHCGTSSRGDVNPYFARLTPDDTEQDVRHISSTPPSMLRAQVLLAWRGSILGLLLCPPVIVPPLLHVYSLWKLFTLDVELDDLPPGLRWRYYAAAALDFAACGTYVVSAGMFYWDGLPDIFLGV